jgi:three-Cys-motif partner protein
MDTKKKQKTVWGGKWTEHKLNAFEKYVNAYLTIMNKHREKNRWKLIYFDAFAGSGSGYSEQKAIDSLSFLESFGIEEADLTVYKGAAERVVCIQQRGFDYYYFIETDDESRYELENKLNALNHNNKLKLIFRGSDANEQISIMAEAMKKDKKLFALTLLDPFGMQVNWSSIEKLTGTNTDLWILIPSGVIINRLIDKNGKLTHIDKLISFFGISEKEIRDYFYEEESDNGLFGTDSEIKKIEKPVTRIAELYVQRLKKSFSQVTDKPLEMRNSKNCPIYHFVFASNNIAAKKIAKDIIGKESR